MKPDDLFVYDCLQKEHAKVQSDLIKIKQQNAAKQFNFEIKNEIESLINQNQVLKWKKNEQQR